MSFRVRLHSRPRDRPGPVAFWRMNPRPRGSIPVALIPRMMWAIASGDLRCSRGSAGRALPPSPTTFPGCARYATSRSISHHLTALGKFSGIRHFFSSASIRKSETPERNHQRLTVTIGVGNSAEASRIPRHVRAVGGRRWMDGMQSRITSVGGEAGRSVVRSLEIRRALGPLADLATWSRPSQVGRFASDLIDRRHGARFPREHQKTRLADQWLGLSMFSHVLGSSPGVTRVGIPANQSLLADISRRTPIDSGADCGGRRVAFESRADLTVSIEGSEGSVDRTPVTPPCPPFIRTPTNHLEPAMLSTRTRLNLESLDHRIVPARLDLRTAGSEAVLAGGAIAHRIDGQWNNLPDHGTQSHGTGALQTYLTVDADGVESRLQQQLPPCRVQCIERLSGDASTGPGERPRRHGKQSAIPGVRPECRSD